MTNSTAKAGDERQRIADSEEADARMGPSIRALGAALTQYINARLSLLKAEWRLTLSALALSFVALAALGALIAMTWLAILVALSYGFSIWLGHWLWGVGLFVLLQFGAIALFWQLSRSLINKIGFKHSLAIEEF